MLIPVPILDGNILRLRVRNMPLALMACFIKNSAGQTEFTGVLADETGEFTVPLCQFPKGFVKRGDTVTLWFTPDPDYPNDLINGRRLAVRLV